MPENPARGRRLKVDVQDVFTDIEVLADQTSNGTDVLTLTFAGGAPQLIWVHAKGGLARVVFDSDTPSSTFGIRCPDDQPTPIVVEKATLKVSAPAGTVVTVYGLRY